MKIRHLKVRIATVLMLIASSAPAYWSTWLSQGQVTVSSSSSATATIAAQIVQKNDVYNYGSVGTTNAGFHCWADGQFTIGTSGANTDTFTVQDTIGGNVGFTFPIGAASTSASPHNFLLSWDMFSLASGTSQKWNVYYQAGQAAPIPTVTNTPTALATTQALTRGPLMGSFYTTIGFNVPSPAPTMVIQGVWNNNNGFDTITFDDVKCGRIP